MARCATIGAAWHAATPHLVVSDTRNLAIRDTDFCCEPEGAVAEVLVTAHGYGGAGRRISSIDARLYTRAEGLAGEPVRPNLRCVFSLSGRELRRESVDAGVRIGFFNAAGGLSWACDGRASEQRRDYDRLGRPLAVHDRLAGEPRHCVERLSYGAADLPAGANLRGQLLRHDDPAGTTTIGARSLSGRPQLEMLRTLVKLVEPDWSVQVAARDALLAAGGAYRTRREYNALDQLQAQRDATGNLQRFSFDLAGQPSAIALFMAPAGTSAAEIPRLPGLLIASHLDYNAAGQLTYARAGNGCATRNDYEPATARLVRRRTNRAAPAKTLQDLQYRYDLVGNVVLIEDRAQPTRFHGNGQAAAACRYVYDSLYRLIEASGRENAMVERPGPGEPPTLHGGSRLTAYRRVFSYDPAGNLTQLRHSSADTRASFTQRWSIAAGSNRAVPCDAVIGGGIGPGAETGSADALADTTDGTLEGAFDSAGNLRRWQGTATVFWNARNQLERVMPLNRSSGQRGQTGQQDADNDCEFYRYDSAGQRRRKVREWRAGSIVHRAEIRYLPGLELHDNTASGATMQVIVVGGPCRLRVLHWDSAVPAGLSQDFCRYSLTDQLGSGTLELDACGRTLSYEEYYPFGATALWAPASALEATRKTVRYSGKERDATGLYYYGARYYAPWLGRWLSPDPAGAVDGLNLYVFVKNSPLSYIDNDGSEASPIAVLDYIAMKGEGNRTRQSPKYTLEHYGGDVEAYTAKLSEYLKSKTGKRYPSMGLGERFTASSVNEALRLIRLAGSVAGARQAGQGAGGGPQQVSVSAHDSQLLTDAYVAFGDWVNQGAARNTNGSGRSPTAIPSLTGGHRMLGAETLIELGPQGVAAGLRDALAARMSQRRSEATYRGEAMPPAVLQQMEYAAANRTAISVPQFMSTSRRKATASSFAPLAQTNPSVLLEIVGQGVPIAGHLSEGEHLYPYGTAFTVERLSSLGGRIRFRLIQDNSPRMPVHQLDYG